MSPHTRCERSRSSRRWILLALTTTLLFAGCQDRSLITDPDVSPELSQVSQDQPMEFQGTQVGPDDWIVVFHPGTNDPPGLAGRLVAEHGGSIRFTYTHALQGFSGTLPPQAIEGIGRNPNVAYVERDGLAYATAVNSWGLDRIDQRDLPLNGTYAPQGDGYGVTVYILDTGIDLRLADRFLGGLSNGWDFIDNDDDSSVTCHSHGTHVAGTVGSLDYGVATMAHIVAVRVLGCGGSGSYAGIIAAIDWVVENATGPAVINMSLSGGTNSSLNTAVASAHAAGVVSSVAAGNDNTNACLRSPASAPKAITVASSTSSDSRSSFSNYGSCVDLFAPGSAITSLVVGGGAATYSGTSMAAPHVAGVSALIMEAYPGIDADGVWTAMQAQATPDRIADPVGSPNLLLFSGTTTPDPCPGGDCPDIKLQWISEVTTKILRNKKASGTVTVQVVLLEGDPKGVEGVTVLGEWTVDGSSVPASGVTGLDGKVEFNSGQFRGATDFRFCVNSLVGNYDNVTTPALPQCSIFGEELGGISPPPTGEAPTITEAINGTRGINITVQLLWEGGDPLVDVLRDGLAVASGIENNFTYTDKLGKNPSGPYVYRVCNANKTECSDPFTVTF